MVRGSDALAIPFSLLWCGFAIFWEASVIASNAPSFFALWGIPFVVIGIYLVIGRFFADARLRANTFYAVTSDRVLIVSGLFSRKVKSLNVKTLTDVSLTQSASGVGSIFFGPQHPFSSMFGGFGGWPGVEQQLGPRFDQIDSAKSEYETILGVQRAAQTRT